MNLSESWSENLSREEAENLALTTLKQVMEEKISGSNIEMCWVDKGGYKLAKKEEMDAVLERI